MAKPRMCMAMQAQLTELDGQKLARGAEEGARRVLRSQAEAQAAADRAAAAMLVVKAASQKVPSCAPAGWQYLFNTGPAASHPRRSTSVPP